MKYSLLFIFALTFSTLSAQSEKNPCLSLAQENIHFFKCDHYGNIYTISDNTLTKYSIDGKVIATYSQQKFGKIESVDVHNPMKIMLYYKNAGIILFLDDNLAPITEPFDLFDNQLSTVIAASYSTSNQIHLFDPSFSELIMLDFGFKTTGKIQIQYQDLNPKEMIELKEKNLIIHDTQKGLFLFDAFGNFDKLIPIISECITIDHNNIYFIKNEKLIKYDFQNLSFDQISFPYNKFEINRFCFYRDKIIILDKKGKIFICPKLF